MRESMGIFTVMIVGVCWYLHHINAPPVAWLAAGVVTAGKVLFEALRD